MKIDTKSLLRMSTASPLQLLRYSAKMHFLPSLCIYLTTSCNYDCFMCDSRRSIDSQRQQMDIELFKKLIEQCGRLRFKPRLHFSGLGEPMVYRHFEQVMEICSAAKIVWSVTTNGLLINRYMKALIEYNCSGINVSIHGVGDAHDTVVGTPGAFGKVKESIFAIDREKAARNSDKPRVAVNCVVNNHNVLLLDEINDEFQGWPVNSITFQHVSYSQKDVCNGAEYIITENTKLDHLVSFMEKTGKSTNNIPVHFFPDLKKTVIKPYHTGVDLDGRNQCFLPWLSLRVYPDGLVKMCEVELGDLAQQDLSEIVNSKKALALRESIRAKKFKSEECYRCCHRKYTTQRI